MTSTEIRLVQDQLSATGNALKGAGMDTNAIGERLALLEICYQLALMNERADALNPPKAP